MNFSCGVPAGKFDPDKPRYVKRLFIRQNSRPTTLYISVKPLIILRSALWSDLNERDFAFSSFFYEDDAVIALSSERIQLSAEILCLIKYAGAHGFSYFLLFFHHKSEDIFAVVSFGDNRRSSGFFRF